MKQGLLLWSPCHLHYSFLSPVSTPAFFCRIPTTKLTITRPISAAVDSFTSTEEKLSARERRQLRNERRERKSAYNWREEVEERLIKKPKKRYTSWTEELNLDNLALLGPQWWIVRVARIRYHEIAEKLARSLARNFPDIEFKAYAPAVQVKKKLKNGTYSVKPRAIFPGCVFLKCVLNKEIHDFIRECDGVGGFIGSKVGNTKRQINKPRPVSLEDMEAVFHEAKEEQERENRAFEEEQQGDVTLKSDKLDLESNVVSNDVTNSSVDTKPKRQSRKASNASSSAKGDKILIPGSTVRVVSGSFADFVGTIKKWNRKTGKVTVSLSLFGKESLVDLERGEVVAETVM